MKYLKLVQETPSDPQLDSASVYYNENSKSIYYYVKTDKKENNKIYYTSSDGKIVIPYSTIAFGSTILSNTYENEKGCITCESDIQYIGKDAFGEGSTLKTIVLPDTVTYIGQYAFSNSGIESITMGNNITSFGESAFLSCTNLKSITIPDNIEEIGPSALQYCENLTSVKYKGTVYTIVNDLGYALEDNDVIIGSNALSNTGLK